MNAKTASAFLRRLGWLALVAWSVNRTAAQPFAGNNPPGTFQDFTFPMGAAASNVCLSVPGSATAFSHLLLKRGGTPSYSDFDFIALEDGQTNAISLERPALQTASYTLRVWTPTNSSAHSFNVTVLTNQAGLRSAIWPLTQPLTSTNQGVLAPGSWHYFRADMASNLFGWRVSLSSPTNAHPDLYVQRGLLPTTADYFKRSVQQTNDSLILWESELRRGACFIGVFNPPNATGTNAYTLQTEPVSFSTLQWDPGTSHLGTEVYTHPNTDGGAYFFKITTQSSAVGGWRTVLNVSTGEASLYLSRGTPPLPNTAQYKSERAGSDGMVLPATAFGPGEDWYVLVQAQPGARWDLVTGEPYVQELGTLTADGTSGSGSVPIGGEGIRFFRTSIPANTPAWRLWLNGVTNQILVKRTAVPLASANDLAQVAQMLVAPTYLVSGQFYFVGVPGLPGSPVTLDSRQHAVRDLPFLGSTNVSVAGYGYTTFRVQVPANQIAWQVSMAVSSGEASLALRRSSVANESNNDAYSEVPGLVTESVTLVPALPTSPPNTPSLSDGTYFVTVYATEAHTFTLSSRLPDFTPINYVGETINTDTNRVGWRFFQLLDLNQQLGSLGWSLLLSNAPPGTRIALRRGGAPGLWNFRSPNTGSAAHYHFISTSQFLQRPRHEAGSWYVGIYHPNLPLGTFTLITRSLSAEPASFDNGVISRADVPPGRWEFFRVEVPATALGWDIRLIDVLSGSPRMVIAKEKLPSLVSGTPSLPAILRGTNWASGFQWEVGLDWTERPSSADGSANEDGRVATLGMRRPLDPGTYYLGVIDDTATTNVATYTVWSRGIGEGLAVPVEDLRYDNDNVSRSGLAPREIAVYRVTVPTNTPSWKVKLATTVGDASLTVARDRLPNITAARSESATGVQSPGRKMLKTGNEHLVLLPSYDEFLGVTNLVAGIYYLVVAAEGEISPTNRLRIGIGTSSYLLQSVGAMPQTRLGFLETTDLVRDGEQLEGGESAAYHFQNRPDTLGFEIHLENSAGYPVATSVGGIFNGDPFEILGDPGAASRSVGRDPYGNEGGEDWGAASPQKIIVADPYSIETVMVKARERSGGFLDAGYRLRIRRLVPDPLAFDCGLATVTNQTDSWKFFQVQVPVGALGWDLRLTNVLRGSPRLVVSRDYLPIGTVTQGWNPGSATGWFSGLDWAAGKDWTGRSYSADGATNEEGRILAMGMGRPLEPGTYYVGISNPGFPTNGMTYSILSRGIGPDACIPVMDLPFLTGIVTNQSLFPREAAYYRVIIPTNASSWQVRLRNLSGESMLLALTNAIPGVLTGQQGSAGRAMQKAGNEQYVLLPATGQISLSPGTNYLAVVSEGVVAPGSLTSIGTGTSSYVLESLGELDLVDLGETGPVDLTATDTLQGGEVRAYRFSLPPEVPGIEARLTTTTGAPAMVLRAGGLFPLPGAASLAPAVGGVSMDPYGSEGGSTLTAKGDNANSIVITVPKPTNSVYTLMVKARQASNAYPDAAYTVRIRTLPYTPVEFDGGSISVTNQVPNNWRFFQVEVPDDTDGWDVRLVQITSGSPRLVIRRDVFPDSFNSSGFTPNAASSSNWPSGAQWAADKDWTRRQYSANAATNEDFRILAMGMGRPLEAGTYYVGVLNAVGTTTPMSYTLLTRGIGEGRSIPVTELPFADGALVISNLPPREAAYFRVEVPTNAASWKLKLTPTAGEAMMLMLGESLPNVDTGQSGKPGFRVQKANNEHLLMLPVMSTNLSLTNLTAGRYYLAVVGEGVNATNATRVGLGASDMVLSSFGSLPPHDLGTVGPSDLIRATTLEGGESALYRFAIPANTLGVEVRLENRTANPYMALRPDAWMPNPGTNFGPVTVEPYGIAGGAGSVDINASLLTLPNPTPGIYSMAVKARGSGSPPVYPDAGYVLRVREMPVPTLNFSSALNTNGFGNAVSGVLFNNQRAFYRVEIPTNVLGWELRLSQSSGSALMRVRRGALPADRGWSGMAFTPFEAVIAPPYLTHGTWYVEVQGNNDTAFTLTSEMLTTRRTWRMPGLGEAVTTPGLTAPEFGDTGIQTNGLPIPGDQGTDLERGYSHYYAITVPTNNVGVLRTQLESLSGNPDLFLRAEHVPTVSHDILGGGGVLYDRVANGTVTEYGNWVPLDGKVDMRLRPGTYYVAVRATGTSNARYRLRLSTGYIQDLALEGGNLSNQAVASNDWRYFRVLIPNEAPTNWTVSFSQQVGDVKMFVRDTVPPGNGDSTLATGIKDWASDNKNRGPYASYDAAQSYTFTLPPVRPGSVYYLGFRGSGDAVFSVSSSSTGSNLFIPTLDFYRGFVTSTIPAHSSLSYRIYAPPDASRLQNTDCVHSNVVQLFLENGTLPRLNSGDDWVSSTANSRFTFYLGGWPWVRDVTYFLVVTNHSPVPQPFSLNLDGRTVANDDYDNDGILDWWERQYFGSINPTAQGDFDGDGVSNLAEYVEGTHPADPASLRPRLSVLATNGVVSINPLASNYTSGTTVTLTARPDAGFVFLGWTGHAQGTENPLMLVLTSNRTVTAQFRVPGDDFVQRVPVFGLSATVTGSNVGASREPGEPLHAGIPAQGAHSVWWSWTAPVSGPVTINTSGSTFANALAVYTGGVVSNLVRLASDLNGVGPTTSQVSFDAVAGTAYEIAVDGGGGATGSITLNLAMQGVLALQNVLRVSDTRFDFTLISSPGQSIRIDVSENLIDWTPLTNVVNTTGSMPISDDSAGAISRFYRATAP